MSKQRSTISDCGTAHEGVLKTLCENIISTRSSGIALTQKDIDNIDFQVATAYKEILSILSDKNQILETLNLLVAESSRNTIETRHLVNVAKDRAREILDKSKKKTDKYDVVSPETTRRNGGENNNNNPQPITLENAVNVLCTESMETNFYDTMQSALAGDTNSVIAADLISKATSFLLNQSEKNGGKNPKRRIAALIYIDKLVSTGNSAAIELADQIINQFDFQEIDIYDRDLENNNQVSVKKVREERNRLLKQNSLDESNTRLDGISREFKKIKKIEQRTKVIKTSYTELVCESMEKTKKKALMKEMFDLLKNEDTENLKTFAQKNPEVAVDLIKKILKRCNQIENPIYRARHLHNVEQLQNVLGEAKKQEQPTPVAEKFSLSPENMVIIALPPNVLMKSADHPKVLMKPAYTKKEKDDDGR